VSAGYLREILLMSVVGAKGKLREGPMTTAAQAFLSAGELFCLSFAAIALVYFADKLRSGF
jgi:hypothetical protein